MPVTGRDCRTLTVDRLDDGVVVLSFLVPGHSQNVLTHEVLEDLAHVLAELASEPEPTGLVLRSAREASFFAGADIGRLERLQQESPVEIERLCAVGRGLFAELSSQPWPSVAVIDGVCLGGGLELALGCDLRIATPASHTVLGFPEVKLGLLPGWGGTVRLARLIGVGPAVELAASGENVDGPAAASMGLVDACVPADQALESARRLIAIQRTTRGYLDRRRAQAGAIDLDPLERDFLEATSSAVILGRTGGHYPAPLAILETVLAGAAVDAAEAGRLEAAAFARLARSPIAAQLLRVFRLGERNRQDAGVDGRADDGAPAASKPASLRAGAAADRKPPAVAGAEVAAPAVVGAGIMGAGIAASHLRAGFALTLVDNQPAAIAGAVAGILEEAAWDRAARRTDTARALALSGRLQTATQMAALAGADLVIESVLERTDVKRQVLAAIEETVAPTTLIATNTSTNPIAKLATALTDPSRFCGIHFFNPVRRMTLVEVVRGPASSDATIAVAVAHAKRLGKCPIVVRDSPGFLVNRLLMPYLHEAVEMLREGVEPRRIDRVARSFGMPMGPIELYDLIGLDTAFYAGLVLNDAYGDRIEASPVIPALVRSGRLGCKSGAGFYRYRGHGGREGAGRVRIEGPDDGVAAIIEPYALAPRQSSDETIANRLFLPVVLEALRALDERIVRDGRDIDLAVIHALGFPAFRGGVLAWADSLGADEILRRLEPLADLGVRMHPTPTLVALARAGGRFTE
jgi:3-hydroxyacyl-CoA dehydrogenase/enoyl-CoA hydratase/carnithine racemase